MRLQTVIAELIARRDYLASFGGPSKKETEIVAGLIERLERTEREDAAVMKAACGEVNAGLDACPACQQAERSTGRLVHHLLTCGKYRTLVLTPDPTEAKVT